jgi:hypothetical protein
MLSLLRNKYSENKFVGNHPYTISALVFQRFTDEELDDLLELSWIYDRPYRLCRSLLDSYLQYQKDIASGKIVDFLNEYDKGLSRFTYPLSTIIEFYVLELPLEDMPLMLNRSYHTATDVAKKRLKIGK